MKTKILQALKTKYSNLGFGDKAFDGVADHLSKTITEETQIDTAVAEVENLLKAFQGDTDKVRGEKANLQKQLDELKAKHEGGNPTPTQDPKKKDDEEVPAWAKAILEESRGLKEQVQQLSGSRISEQRLAIFEQSINGLSEKNKANELATFKRIVSTFKDDDDFNSFLEEKKVVFAELQQEEANNGLSRTGRPGGGASAPTGEATEKEINDVVGGIKF